MKWMCIILSVVSVACEEQPKKVTHHHHVAKHGRVAARSSCPPSIVDSDWVAHYQALEKEFHYTVPDDNKIKSVGNGFDVPKSVRTHYEDMLRAKGEQDANR